MRALYPKRDWAPIEAWDDDRYDRMIKRTKTPPVELEAQRVASQSVVNPLLFSIVVPLYQTPVDFFVDMVESVLAQTYPHFELILVNASPDCAELCNSIAQYQEQDPRIKVVALKENFGITENTNFGIAVAQGSFVCFLDHDDWIEPDTLFEYAAAINQQSDIDMLYCDEDVVEGRRESWHFFHPMLKPDFSPELLMCKNYLVHLLAVRKSILDALPKPDSEFDGAQDYNLTLRVSEITHNVHHVPRVLYHWRASSTSTATDGSVKPYALRSSSLSVKLHLDRTNANGYVVESGIPHIHNIWFKPDCQTKVSIVVTKADGNNNDSLDMTLEVLSQVNTYENIEIVYVGDIDESLRKTMPATLVSRTTSIATPAGSSMYARFNAGAHVASGDVLVFLDTGCSFQTPEPIEQIVGLLERPGVGIAAPKVLYADNTVKHFGIGVSQSGITPLYRGFRLDYYSYLCSLRSFQNASAAGYQGLAIRKDLFSRIGGFDETFRGELGSIALCRNAIDADKRIATTCTVVVLTTEIPPEYPYDKRGSALDYPPEEISRFRDAAPERIPKTDPFRSPYFDQSTGYPVINPVLL